VLLIVASADRRAAAVSVTARCSVSTTAASLPPAVTLDTTTGLDWSTYNIDHIAVYPTLLPTTSSTDSRQMHQFLNGAGQIQPFPAAAALVDVLRMSSVGPSLLLTPTHSLLRTPPAVHALQPLGLYTAGDCQPLGLYTSSDCQLHLTATAAATQQLFTVQPDELSAAAAAGLGKSHCVTARDLSTLNPPLTLLPCSNINALLTTATFQTHFLPTVRPVIGGECEAAQRVIGCECCESPMTGVVCLQSPPLASH